MGKGGGGHIYDEPTHRRFIQGGKDFRGRRNLRHPKKGMEIRRIGYKRTPLTGGGKKS